MSELLDWGKIWEEERSAGTDPTYPVGFQWKDYPSRLTPLSAENLNQLNDAIDKLDERVVDMGRMVDEVANESESWAVGTRDGVIDVQRAEDNSKFYKEESEAYAIGTKGGQAVQPGETGYQNNAAYYSAQANESAGNASASEQEAQRAEGSAITYEGYAQRYANGTTNPTNPTPISEGIGYHDNAKYYKQLAEDWTVGTIDGVPDPTRTENNTKYYRERAEAWTQGTIDEIPITDPDDPAKNSNAKKWRQESEGWAVGTIDNVADVDYVTNNSKYWNEESQAWATGKKGSPATPVSIDDPYHRLTNNSEYFSNISHNYAQDSEVWAVGTRESVVDPVHTEDNAKYYAESAGQSASAASASEIAAASSEAAAAASAEEAYEFAGVAMPHFHLDWETMELIQEDDGAGIVFTLDVNKNLTYEIVRQ